MFSETIKLRGHIIDSLILPKVLDQILTRGASFKIAEIKIGQKRADQSFARIEVSAETSDALDELILRLRQHGAEVAERADAQLAPAPADGVFPPEFYVMTNQQTFVRVDGKEIEVRPTMMDTAIAVDRKGRAARAVKFFDVHKGDEIVIGHQGVRVVLCSARRRARIFFNSSTRSSMLMNRNRPLFANWLRNFDARARRKAKSQLWPARRSCGPVPISIWSGSLKP